MNKDDVFYFSVSPCIVFSKLPPADPDAAHHNQHGAKRESYYVPYCYSGNLQGNKTVCSGGALNNSAYSILMFCMF